MSGRGVRLVALTSLLCASNATFADAQARVTVVPALAVSSVHDDNLFSREDAVGDYLTQLRPSLDAVFESRTLRLDTSLWFDMQHSARHASLTTFDARRHATVDMQMKASPDATFGILGRFDKTETPGELNLESGIFLNRQGARRWELGPSHAYRLDSRTTLNARYTWTHETLRGDFDADLQVARVGVVRQRSALTTWSAGYLGRVFTGVVGLPIHYSHVPLFGATRRFTPATRGSVYAGPRFTSYRGPSAEVLATVARATPQTRLLLDYWHGETIVLGIPGPVRIHSATSKVSWTVKRTLELGTHLGVFRNTSLDQARTHVYHASVVAAWNPDDTYILSASYGADFQRGDIRSHLLNEAHMRRGVFLVRFTVAPRFTRGIQQPDDPTQFSPPVKGVVR
jgi:hypothetical protein